MTGISESDLDRGIDDNEAAHLLFDAAHRVATQNPLPWCPTIIHYARFTDPEMVMRLLALTNQYGIDGDHTSAVLAWAAECFQEGLIDTRDTDGLILD